jgi:2,4-dienoyl-CoA reductase-like NADH-dependent reductase (Old Yellow Enzyme family)
MSKLFTPLQIKGITLKNRIVVSPMCQYSALDGFANDWHFVHLASRAIGGAGLIITEATAVSPEGRITPDDLGIWSDDHIEKLRRITSFITDQGSVPGIQLAHAGRKASTFSPWKGKGKIAVENGGWMTFAPSDIPYSKHYPLPLKLQIEDINQVVKDFAFAAERAVQAGFKVIELHCAHGYLLHQFISPLTNERDDTYGGNFENRIRILLEIIKAVKKRLPEDFPLFVRISATDWAEGGWDTEDSVRLSEILLESGVDLIDVSTGGLVSHQQITVGPGYQLPFASEIKRKTGILTGAVGMISNAIQAETILNNGDADLIVIAREMLNDPYFPLHAAAILGEDVSWPVQYERVNHK